MPNILGPKWGEQTLGTSGGVVTWSYSEVLPQHNGFTCLCITTPDPNPAPQPTYNDVERYPEILLAFQSWSQFGNIEFVNIAPQEDVPTNQIADIRFHFDGTSDEELSVEFVPDQSGEGLGGDVYINAAPFYPSPWSYEVYDFDVDYFRGLLLREIGNALELGTVAENSVMSDVVSFSELQDDDKLGISQIYGPQSNNPSVYEVTGKTPFHFGDAPDDLVIEGNRQNNTISGDAHKIYGLGGSDTLLVRGSGENFVFGGDGRDKITGRDGNNKLYGDNGWDTIASNRGDDELYGGAGKDTLILRAGDSFVDGGTGRDVADFREYHGLLTVTMIDPGQDHSVIGGNVLLNIEKVIAGETQNQIYGNSAANKIIGWRKDDTLHGNEGKDTIVGAEGDDEIDGGAGNDKLRGDVGDDTLNGGAGNDKVNGGLGDDTLKGGSGDDILNGSDGNDVFVFADDHGRDRIKDFDFLNSKEFIDLSDLTGFDGFQDVLDAARNTFKGVLIETAEDSWIRLDGVRLNHLSADDFIF